MNRRQIAEKIVKTIKQETVSSSYLSIFKDAHSNANSIAKKLKNAHSSVQSDINDIRSQIPLLVRSIWGKRAESVLQHHKDAAASLLRRWQNAEHQLIVVANSLTTLKTGQKLVSVGIPFAASSLFTASSASTAQCFSTQSTLQRKNTPSKSIPFNELRALISQLALVLAEELALLKRGIFLFFLFLPLIATSPACLLSDAHRQTWNHLLTWTLKHAGPAFIKWGQWAATRPDLFSRDIREALTELQTKAPIHAFSHSKHAIERAFGYPLEYLFEHFDEMPVASGSIAQVHKAVLSEQGAALALSTSSRSSTSSSSSENNRSSRNKSMHRENTASIMTMSSATSSTTDITNMNKNNNTDIPHKKGGLLPLKLFNPKSKESATFVPGAPVAVKIRHPGVNEMMELDFILMQRAAALASVLPGLSGASPQLKESLMQFGAPMREQLDLRCEAAHLTRFSENFKWWSGVRFPLPARAGMVASDVLVESFEEGENINTYVGTSCPHNKRLADIGMQCYLKMLLNDNFIHADLHPGNILVRVETANPNSLFSRIGMSLGWDVQLPRLVLLDVGMTARLSQDDRHHMLGFLESLTSLDGYKIAESVLKFSAEQNNEENSNSSGNGMGDVLWVSRGRKNNAAAAASDGDILYTKAQTEEKMTKFKEEMAALFATFDPEYVRLNTQNVISDMMDAIRRHGVHIKGIMSTVVVTTMVLEGWSTQLDPEIRVMETMKGMLPSAWKSRVGNAVDQLMLSFQGNGLVF